MRIFTLGNFKDRRKELRKRSTPEEHLLWAKLRAGQLGYKFRRQHSIGPYIADFYCSEKKLIIELDGNQHLDNKGYDLERTNYFESLDIKVLRFWNDEINNIEKIISRIIEFLK
jgi:very-short-patch-repair endonuclease